MALCRPARARPLPSVLRAHVVTVLSSSACAAASQRCWTGTISGRRGCACRRRRRRRRRSGPRGGRGVLVAGGRRRHQGDGAGVHEAIRVVQVDGGAHALHSPRVTAEINNPPETSFLQRLLTRLLLVLVALSVAVPLVQL